MSATVSVHSLSAFYEKNIGYGLAMESPVKSWWFNPWVGYAVYNDDREVISIQNYFQLPYNLRLYILMDTGDRMPNKNGDRPSDGSPLVGGTWEFAENFFVKIYYEGKSKKALIELTFAFANTK